MLDIDSKAVDYQGIRFWIDIGMLAWAFMVSGFVIWDRRNKVTQEAIQTLKHEVAKERQHIDEALAHVRARQADTPTRSDLAQLYTAINEVSSVSIELRGTVHALQNTMQMINQHLLDK